MKVYRFTPTPEAKEQFGMKVDCYVGETPATLLFRALGRPHIGKLDRTMGAFASTEIVGEVMLKPHTPAGHATSIGVLRAVL